MSDKMKVALVGCGLVGRKRAAAIVADIRDLIVAENSLFEFHQRLEEILAIVLDPENLRVLAQGQGGR